MWHGQPRASLRSDGESKTCQKRSGREERDHVVGLGACGLRAARGARVQPVRPGRTARRHAGTRGFARARAPTWTGFSASDTECLTELTISTSSAGAAVLISSSKIISEASVSWRLMVDMVLRGTRAGEDDHGSARARHGRSVRTCREKCYCYLQQGTKKAGCSRQNPKLSTTVAAAHSVVFRVTARYPSRWWTLTPDAPPKK